jgi:predicted DNA-binding transcriptional regulator AlpA
VTAPRTMTRRRARAVPALLTDARGAAAALGVSRSSFYSLDAQGAVPEALSLGLGARRRRLWSVIELREWVRAGAPPRHEWTRMRKANP